MGTKAQRFTIRPYPWRDRVGFISPPSERRHLDLALTRRIRVKNRSTARITTNLHQPQEITAQRSVRGVVGKKVGEGW